MKKLWIITELFPPDETSTSYIMGEIAEALSTKYLVNIICGSEIYDISRKKTETLNHSNNYTIHRISNHSYNKNRILDKIISYIIVTFKLYRESAKRIRIDDKVLMVTNPAPLIIFIARLKQRRKFNLSILVHDIFPENIKSTGIEFPLYSLIVRIFNASYKRADLLIALGRDMKHILKQKTKNSSKIEIIENWGDFKNIIPKDMPSSDKIIVQYAGNLGRVQGLENVISSIPENVELHIYGSGAMEKKLKMLSKENVIFHGPFSRNEQSEILGSCHISIVTLDERMYGLGTPSKVYNILAAARPILYFGPKNTEVERLVKEHNIGYCGWPRYWDIKTLQDMGKRAREIGEKYYTKDAILKKFKTII